MIGMQNKQTINSFGQSGGYFLLAKHHVQEVFWVAQSGIWRYKVFALQVTMGVGGQSWHLSQQLLGYRIAIFLLTDVNVVVMNRRQPGCSGLNNGQLLGAVERALDDINNALVKIQFGFNAGFEVFKLSFAWQFTIQQ